jgi:hypothetical protein
VAGMKLIVAGAGLTGTGGGLIIVDPGVKGTLAVNFPADIPKCYAPGRTSSTMRVTEYESTEIQWLCFTFKVFHLQSSFSRGCKINCVRSQGDRSSRSTFFLRYVVLKAFCIYNTQLRQPCASCIRRAAYCCRATIVFKSP